MVDGYYDIEKRSYKRIRLKFQIEIEDLNNHRLLSLISRDISVGGLGISRLAPEGMEIFTEEELLPETPVGIRMMLPGCESEIILKGDVRWSERRKTGIWRAGIEFERPQIAIRRYYIKDEGYDAADKRRLKGYYHLFQIEVREAGSKRSHVGLSANLNSNNMQLFSDVLFSTDTPVEIKMRIFGTNEKLKVKGKILWAREEEEDTWRMAVEFNEPLPLEKFKHL